MAITEVRFEKRKKNEEQDERTEQREQRAEKKRQCVYYSGIVYVSTGNCGSSYLDKQPDSKCTV